MFDYNVIFNVSDNDIILPQYIYLDKLNLY